MTEFTNPKVQKIYESFLNDEIKFTDYLAQLQEYLRSGEHKKDVKKSDSKGGKWKNRSIYNKTV